MSSKTFVFGILITLFAVILSSGRALTVEPDLGYNPGERLPMLEVMNDDEEMAGQAIVAVWSAEDATSRLVNVWASHQAAKEGVPFVSICVDGRQGDAELLAKLDHVNARTQVMGAVSSDTLNRDVVQALSRRAVGKVFYTQNGTTQEVTQMASLWSGIQRSE
ncbi:MAG: hypothetical protein Q4D93_05605 [Porphyromonas sp.]|nr:hypothetical protein [Porphyromonas sp.]